MIKFIKECWFGLLLSLFVLVCLLLTVVIAIAPHNDAKMRGFTPCTYQLVLDFEQDDIKATQALGAIGQVYMCYLGVMKDGLGLYLDKKQPTPWANYLFVPESVEEIPEEGEPFSDDLIKANMLDEEQSSDDLWKSDDETKENVDEQK